MENNCLLPKKLHPNPPVPFRPTIAELPPLRNAPEVTGEKETGLSRKPTLVAAH
jgi:hypothetical protein